MAKSDLTRMETSGVIRKLKKLSYLDTNLGIIGIPAPKISHALKTGLDTFAAGGFNEIYGLDIMNRIIGGNGMRAISVTRKNNAAFFTIAITSVFDDRTIIIKYPDGGYK